MRLQGFTNPLTPEGRASLVEPTPHQISADAIRVFFRGGEHLARHYLPDHLEPVDGGLGFAFVADMLKTSDSEPDQAWLNPERTQYGEGIIGFFCKYGEMTGRFSTFIWVTEDWSMHFGQVMGWPKKMASIAKTRTNPFNPGMQAVGPGSKIKGIVHKYGDRLLEVGVEIEKAEETSAMPRYGDRGFMIRHFPAVGEKAQGITQLLSLQLSNVATGDVFSGKPFLKIGTSDSEELAPLAEADLELVSGWAYKQGWTTDTTAELLEDYSFDAGTK
jgi:hypothetical protein